MMLLVVYVIFGFLNFVSSSSDTDESGFNEDVLNGEVLIRMGRRTKHPMLTMIGMAIRNLHPCLEWTQWSGCSARQLGYFGTRNRTRTCPKQKTDGTFNSEEDIGICEGKCATGFNATENDFCLKLHNQTKTWEDAENLCQSEGGHLVYIDSEIKFNDVKTMLQGFGAFTLIDGRRKDVNSPWQSVRGVVMTKFFWHSSQPDNGSTELCLVLRNDNTREWHDATCTTAFYPLCEILAA